MTVASTGAGRRGQNGFTLIEVMVTVLIVALLAAIAYPAYTEQIRKAKRAEGRAALLKAAQLEERWFTSGDPKDPTKAPAYTTDLATLFGSGSAVPRSGEDPTKGNYELAAAAPAGLTITDGFVLTATPIVGVFDDPICGNLTLDYQGNRGFSGAKGTKDICW